MIYLYSAGIFISLIGIYIKNKNFKSNYLPVVIILFFYYFCLIEGDLQEYEKLYQMAINGYELYHANEMFYMFLMRFFGDMHLSFMVFKNVLFTFAVLLNIKLLSKTTYRCEFFCLCFLLYFVFIDGLQLRGYLAFSVLMFGIDALFEDKKGIVKFLICLTIATLIQSTMILFAVLLVAKVADVKYKKIVRGLLLVVLFISVFIEKQMGIITSIINLYEPGNVYTTVTINNGWLIGVCMYLINVIMLLFTKYLLDKYINDEEHKLLNNKYSIVYRIHSATLLFIPFLFINLSFYRFIRYEFLYCVLFYSGFGMKLKNYSIRTVYVFSVVFSTLCYLYLDCTIHGNFSDFIMQSFLQY